jgi:hypothetical protein
VAAQAEGSIHFNAPVLLANALAAFALNLVSRERHAVGCISQVAAGWLMLRCMVVGAYRSSQLAAGWLVLCCTYVCALAKRCMQLPGHV